MTPLHDIAWFAEQIGKGQDWVRRHLADIPHHRVGASLRVTEQDRDEYLESVRVAPIRMPTTG